MLELARRLLPGGLRAQVTLAIASITALAIGLSFLAVHRGTGVRLHDRGALPAPAGLATVETAEAGRLRVLSVARPVRRMADLAAAVDTGDLSLRAGAIGARGELGILAGAFDRMLARLERAFARQRDVVSDASHELRTPLAVLRAQVEVLDRETDDPHRCNIGRGQGCPASARRGRR